MGSIFNKDGTVQNIKSDHRPLSIPNIPLFHHSIIPSCHSASKGKLDPSGVKLKPGPLGQDSLLSAKKGFEYLKKRPVIRPVYA